MANARPLPHLSCGALIWRGAVAVIGNAPTALFHLLNMLENPIAPPAAINGCPVGFIGAQRVTLIRAACAVDDRPGRLGGLRWSGGGDQRPASRVGIAGQGYSAGPGPVIRIDERISTEAIQARHAIS
jgi:hypothetical protein